MSPHFQTRIYIDDAAAASMALQSVGYSVDNAEKLLSVYAKEMAALHTRMIGAGYAKAFVDLDLLLATMRPSGWQQRWLLAAAVAVVAVLVVVIIRSSDVGMKPYRPSSP